MFALFRSLTDRVKALFVTSAALDFEADFAARQAERKAELLRRAAEFEREGLPSVSKDLRSQAEALSIQRPLATVLPAIEHLAPSQDGAASVHLLPLAANGTDEPGRKKKGRHSLPARR